MKIVRVTPDRKQFACDCDVIHADSVDRVRLVMPGSEDFQKLAGMYQLLANTTRAQILWALTQEDLCVCDLAVLLGMTKSAISHQLKALRLANLVKCDKQGKVVYYSLADAHVKDMLATGFEHSKE